MQVTCIVYNNTKEKNNFKNIKDFNEYKSFGQDRFQKFFINLDIASQDEIGDRNFLYDLQFCIKDVQDVVNLQSDRNFFTLLDVKPHTIDLVKKGQGYFVINLPTEGIFDDWFINGIKDYFRHYGIPQAQIIYINNAVNGEKLRLKKHIGIRNVFYPYFINDYAYRRKVDVKSPYKDKKYKFLCYNRNLHEHRIAFYTLMHKYKLLDQCLYSMPLLDEIKGTYTSLATQCLRTGKNFKKLGITLDLITEANNNLPLSVDKFDRSLINTSPDMWTHHKESFISLVTETYFYDTSSIHITEKTFKPISFCQPFLLLSTPGSLKYLKKLGFRTFSQYWDESYDDIKDPNERMLAVLKIVRRISNWSPTMCEAVHKDMQVTVDYNKKHLKTVMDKHKKISTSIWRT